MPTISSEACHEGGVASSWALAIRTVLQAGGLEMYTVYHQSAAISVLTVARNTWDVSRPAWIISIGQCGMTQGSPRQRPGEVNGSCSVTSNCEDSLNCIMAEPEPVYAKAESRKGG